MLQIQHVHVLAGDDLVHRETLALREVEGDVHRRVPIWPVLGVAKLRPPLKIVFQTHVHLEMSTTNAVRGAIGKKYMVSSECGRRAFTSM